MYECILFDMEGTLLDLDTETFVRAYYGRMQQFFEERYPGQGEAVLAVVHSGGKVMMKNDGTITNEAAFWQHFEAVTPWRRAVFDPLFQKFYAEVFPSVGEIVVPNEHLRQAVTLAEAKGYPLVLATTPILPEVANHVRLSWVGLDGVAWREVAGFERFHYSKPNPAFFAEICEHHGFDPTKCLLIGNSLTDDVAAKAIGMTVYILLDHVADGDPADYPGPKGYSDELLTMIEILPKRIGSSTANLLYEE